MNDITRMLNAALPDDPDPSGWAAGARRRSAARRTGRAAAVVALVAAVVVPLGYLASRGPDIAVPAGTPSGSPSAPSVASTQPVGPPTQAPVVPAGENPCAAIRAESREGALQFTPFDGDLPDGALRAWLCGDPNQGYDTVGGPAEPLTEGVDQLVTAFNALEPLPQDIACTQEYRLTYVVVVDYPDGSKRLRGELHGCGVVSDGERLFSGGEGFLDTLLGLWEQQRAGRESPTEAPEVCPPLSTLLAASPDDIVAGYVCATYYDEVRVQDELPGDLAARIAAAMGEGVGGEAPWPWLAGGDAIVLADGWGSVITVEVLADGGFAVQNGWLTEPVAWAPSAELAAELQALLGSGASPTP